MSFGPESHNPRERRAYAHAIIAKARSTGSLNDAKAAEQAVARAGSSRKTQKSHFESHLASLKRLGKDKYAGFNEASASWFRAMDELNARRASGELPEPETFILASAVPTARIEASARVEIPNPGADKLRDLKTLVPDLGEHAYSFAKLLAGRVDPTIDPIGFVMAVDLAIMDLQLGEDGFTGKPITGNLVGLPLAGYLTLRILSTVMAQAAYSDEFSQGVHEALSPPQA